VSSTFTNQPLTFDLSARFIDCDEQTFYIPINISTSLYQNLIFKTLSLPIDFTAAHFRISLSIPIAI
jgi:hypothetical protein